MVDTDKLRGKFAEKRLSQEKVAESIGISSRTLSNRMKNGVFGADEIEKLCELLEIENPLEIFFAKKVNRKGDSPMLPMERYRERLEEINTELKKVREYIEALPYSTEAGQTRDLLLRQQKEIADIVECMEEDDAEAEHERNRA